MKAIGYIRCSTQEQADSGLGLEAQAKRLRAYCAMKGVRMIDLVTDAGESGGKPLGTRPGGQRLLAAIRERKADAVIMLKLDRGFRNATDCLTTVEHWERKRIALHIVDLDRPYSILASLARLLIASLVFIALLLWISETASLTITTFRGSDPSSAQITQRDIRRGNEFREFLVGST